MGQVCPTPTRPTQEEEISGGRTQEEDGQAVVQMADTIKESKDPPAKDQEKQIPKAMGIAKEKAREILKAKERGLATSSTQSLVARTDQTVDTSTQGSNQRTRYVLTVAQRVTGRTSV